jgi:hypothetical protein
MTGGQEYGVIWSSKPFEARRDSLKPTAGLAKDVPEAIQSALGVNGWKCAVYGV